MLKKCSFIKVCSGFILLIVTTSRCIHTSKIDEPIVAELLKKNGVVPDVVDKAPMERLTVKYPSGATVDMGNILTPTQVKDMPSVSWPASSQGVYTLCMTAPFAPEIPLPKYREWQLWLVGNILGTDVAGGETLSEYMSPTPREGTGLSRYVFLVYKQTGQITFDEPRLTNRSRDNRDMFSIKRFAAKYNLGDPVAGNLFRAEWDEIVPSLNEYLNTIG